MIQKKLKLINKNEINGEKITLQFAENVQIDSSNPQQPRPVASTVVTVQLSGNAFDSGTQLKTGNEYTVTIE